MSMTRMGYVHTEWTGEHFILISPLIHLVLWHTYMYMYPMYIRNIFI